MRKPLIPFLLFLGIVLASSIGYVNAQQPKIIYLYDALGRLKQVIDDQGNVRTYNYDAVGNLLSIEAGGGVCPVGPPVVVSISPDECLAGTTCQLTIDGDSLLGAGVASNNPQAPVSNCQTDCTRITCFLSPSPFITPGPVDIRVTNPLGSAQASIDILPPPELSGAGQSDVWHFAANRGTVVTIQMTRIANQPNGSSTLDPLLELQDSRGVLLAEDDDSGSNTPPGPGRNAIIRNFSLPATDTYVVLARGVGGTSGPYVLEINPRTVVLVPGPITPPIPEIPAFVFTGAITSLVERDTYTFPANRHAVVTIQVNRVANNPDGSGTLDPALELRDSRGILVKADDDSGTNEPFGPGRNALITNLTLPATDTYSLSVFGSSGTTGPYEVKVFIAE